MRELHERILDNVGVAMSVSDVRQPDNPLVWVNSSFETMTGYPPAEAVGRNCRFLQGPESDGEAVQTVREAIAAERSVTVTLRNYRRDGSDFWNEVTITPIRDDDGALISFAAVMVDVSQRVEREAQLLHAHAAEREAREAAERARQTQSLLADATSLLTASLDVGEALDRLVALVIPRLADWAVVTLIDAQGQPSVAAVRHRDVAQSQLLEYAKLQAQDLSPTTAQGRVLATGEPVLIEQFPPPEEYARRTGNNARLIEIAERLGLGSAIVVPLAARRRLLGTLSILVGPERAGYTDQDVAVAVDLGRRAALAVDNARLYQRERRVAEALQRSLLPDLPEVPGLDIAVRYLPGDEAAQVGGDFYEVLNLPDGAVALAIGDVLGHDMRAAAQMGHLRGLLRACAWESPPLGGESPAAVLYRVDRLVEGLHVAPMATMAYLRLEPPSARGEHWQLAYSSAGHPHVLLRKPTGVVSPLDEADGLLLGVDPTLARTSAHISVPAGSLLLLYTDGLVERRGEDIGDSELALRRWLSSQPMDVAPEQLCEATLDYAGSQLDDDIAVLVVRLDAASDGQTSERSSLL